MTPVLDPMVLAERKNGGNPMDAPMRCFITVNFALTLLTGQTNVPVEVEDALLALKQCVYCSCV